MMNRGDVRLEPALQKQRTGAFGHPDTQAGLRRGPLPAANQPFCCSKNTALLATAFPAFLREKVAYFRKVKTQDSVTSAAAPEFPTWESV